MFAGACGGVGGELGVAGGVPADPGQSEVADDQRRVVVLEVAGLVVAVTPVGLLGAVPDASRCAQGLVRRGVAPALREAVSVEPELVRPASEPERVQVPPSAILRRSP